MFNKIKETRTNLGMTQSELARNSGLSRYLISKLENGEDVNVTKNTMIRISKALGKKVSDIFLI